MDAACSSTRRASPCSPAFRNGLYYPLPSGTSYLAIAIAADSESAAPPREMTGSPNSALREELTVASADALHDSSTGSARMKVPVSRCCSSGGGARTPRPPRGVGPTRGYGVCQRSRDETLDSAGSFSTSVPRTLTLTLTPLTLTLTLIPNPKPNTPTHNPNPN